MNAKKLAAACLIAGATVLATGGVATAAPDEASWQVYGVYANTTDGQYRCQNAANNLPPSYYPNCRPDDEAGTSLLLWVWI
jgi:hypothetical protein